MSNLVPPGGWPLRVAIVSLATAEWQTTADLVVMLEGMRFIRPDYLKRKRDTLWTESLLLRLVAREIVVRGIRYGTAEADTIGIEFLADATPDYDANTLTCAELTYHAIRVHDAIHAPALTLAEPTPQQRIPSGSGKGGRPPKDYWPDFIREMIRFADLDGIASRTELVRHMMAWCSANLAEPPDERTVQRKVKDLCPLGVPDR